mmetsp:Transcript_30637/g.55975  ORF Transcript_30637/g.55975 Transcript_30637/m.55975 type:complete len:135 (-) Transcript_30637:55-459(-)
MGGAAASGTAPLRPKDGKPVSDPLAFCPCNATDDAPNKLEIVHQGVNAHCVDGYWRTVTIDREPKLVGLIDQGCVWWHPHHEHEPTRLRCTAEGHFQMELNNSWWTAVYSEGPPSSLSWNDGEVWVRDPDFEYM